VRPVRWPLPCALRPAVLAASALAALALVSAPGAAHADERPGRAAVVPLTALAAGELGRASHVALGTVVEVKPYQGMLIARCAIERWLKGEPEGADISVVVHGPQPGLHARQVTRPFLEAGPGDLLLLFLARRPGGVTFSLENRSEIVGPEGAEKVRAVEAQVRLEAIPDVEARARAVLTHFLGALAGRGAWTRANAARELCFLAQRRPDVFTLEARDRIQGLADGGAAPAVKAWLRALVELLERAPVGRRPGSTPSPPPDAAAPAPAAVEALVPEDDESVRLARLDALLASTPDAGAERALKLLHDRPEPALRAWIVDWLAESGHTAVRAQLKASYAREDSAPVREAIVRAHGLLGDEDDVPWLVERLANARLADAALLALARIRGPRALAALEQHRVRCLAGDEEQQARAARIEHLVSPVFEESERTSGHRLGPERRVEPGR
jgi:hypothetical protein